ncbi:MAG: ABC transporter ATP-binding protein [Longimicrobiales bacterium]
MTGRSSTEPLLEIEALRVAYPDRRRRGRRTVDAVRGIDLSVARGEAVGLVGESGSGKSSLARAVVGVVPVAAGRVRVGGDDLSELRASDPLAAARRVQMVFQDALGALDPRQRIGSALREVLAVHGRATGDAGGEAAAVTALLTRVGLEPDHADRFPHQLSGGQRQRVGIARALAVEPEVLILDEPVSALDVSVQAQILALLDELRRSLDLAILFIAHDLAVVRNVCDRVAVSYRGRLMEIAPTEALFTAPRHPYTRTLLHAVPTLGERGRGEPAYAPPAAPDGDPDSPGGCAWYGRCSHPARDAACTASVPAPAPVAPGHRVACMKEATGPEAGVDTSRRRRP